MTKRIIRVVELFAGVGGFRLGLQRGLEPRKTRYRFVWANQWEPNRRKQYAFECYTHWFGTSENHVNADIATVVDEVPQHDLLVGGFPCQDYSVARTQARGIEGRKGVLWWQINNVLRLKRPPYVLLENVDRLLRSPASQRGRDFGVMLRCFSDLGYTVEWRVINAADYGNHQRRRRVFIFATLDTTPYSKSVNSSDLHAWLTKDGFFAQEFPVDIGQMPPHLFMSTEIGTAGYPDLVSVSSGFKFDLRNAGIVHDGQLYTTECVPVSSPKPLGDVLEKGPIDERFFIRSKLDKWKYLKGPKHIRRFRPNGEEYYYAEGAIPFPDPIDRPARTMLTSEGKLNRSTHIVADPTTGEYRLLTPPECERLNGFLDGWTDTGMPESFRYFTMGNALVVPLIERMGRRLERIIP